MAGKTKLKAGCGVTLVFSAGFLFGMIALFIFMVKIIPLSEGWRDEESKEFVMNHLRGKLALSEEQVEQIRPLVSDALDERYSHRKRYVAADIELTRKAFDEMAPYLDREQIERGERLFSDWENGKQRFLLGKEAR